MLTILQQRLLRVIIFYFQLTYVYAQSAENPEPWPQCKDEAEYLAGTCCKYEMPGLQCPAAIIELNPAPAPIACTDDMICKAEDCNGTCKDSFCECDKIQDNPYIACTDDAPCAAEPCLGTCKDSICQCQDDHPSQPSQPSRPAQTPLLCNNDEDCTNEACEEECVGNLCQCKSEPHSFSSTITVLPPEASTQTITDQLTDGLVTTTTSEGSDEPTVIPIIIPFKGPPILCWNCMEFPADAKIKTPDFCVQILGTSIGKCPPEDQPKPGGSEDSNEPDTSRDTPNNPDEPDEPEPSCSTTVTATYVSVFCTVTEEPGAPQRRAEEQPGCSTLAYSSITACEDVAGSTETITSTIVPEETGLCSPDTCGANGCAISKRGGLFKRILSRISEPEPGNWAEAKNYDDDTDKMVAGEVNIASDPRYEGNSVSLTDKDGTIVQRATFQSIEFKDTPQTLSVHGLFGCTSVFVVSRRGAWGSHIWEGRAQPIDGILNILRGLRPSGAMFDQSESPHIFISTSRPRPKDENGASDFESSETTADEAGDPERIAEIKEYVTDKNGQLWGPLTQVNYQAMPWNNAAAMDQDFATPRGKVLVQYRPADPSKDCSRQNAQWRIWIEGAAPGEDRSDSWSPSDSQVFKAGGAAKRQEGCAIDSGDSDKPDGESNDNRPDESNESDEEPLPALTPGACKEQSDCPLSFCAGGGPGSSSTPTCKDDKCVCEAVELSPAPGSCKEQSDCPPAFCAGGGPGSSGTPTCKDKQCVCEDATAPPDISCKNKDECGNKLDCSEGQEAACEGGRCLCKDLPDLSCSQDDICSDKLKSCEPSEEAKCDGGQCKCLPRPTFASGTCTAHIFEAANSKSLAVQIIIYDGKGDKIHEYADSDETGYDRTVTIKKEKLPDDVAFEFLGSFLKKRDRPEPSSTDARLKYQAYGIKITAGDTHWTTNDREENELPRCELGGWDTHESWNPAYIAEGLYRLVMKIFGQEINDSKVPTRDMDCRWKC